MRTGVQLNLITCSLVALVAFGFKELKWGITFTIISIISFIVSSLYKTSLLEYKELTEHQMIVQFTLNLILFITVSFYSIFILLRQNFKIEKKLHEKNTSLNELNMAKDRLFSIIGHDLKAPLNSLSAFASLLAVNAVSEAEIKMLSKSLTHSINNTRNLLEDLLEWAQSQTGLIGFEPERFDLSLVVKENIQLIAPSATEKKITLTNDIQGEVFVNAHRNSINMVVRNLLSNAIKFTKEGGAVTIFITVSNQVIVSVQDTGIGIAQETARRLFQLGKTVSTLGTANEKGTGLGLILCREFIEKNGGSIGVESKEGEGSRFYFTLPTR
ncbi:MAG: sensor histidine kinase [Flammeovirgaceae bacterium]